MKAVNESACEQQIVHQLNPDFVIVSSKWLVIFKALRKCFISSTFKRCCMRAKCRRKFMALENLSLTTYKHLCVEKAWIMFLWRALTLLFTPGMFLTMFWNRWISVLIKNWCSEVPSAVSSSQTPPLKKIFKHFRAEAMFSFTVYL